MGRLSGIGSNPVLKSNAASKKAYSKIFKLAKKREKMLKRM